MPAFCDSRFSGTAGEMAKDLRSRKAKQAGAAHNHVSAAKAG
jgi:hypothetical protein